MFAAAAACGPRCRPSLRRTADRTAARRCTDSGPRNQQRRCAPKHPRDRARDPMTSSDDDRPIACRLVLRSNSAVYNTVAGTHKEVATCEIKKQFCISLAGISLFYLRPSCNHVETEIKQFAPLKSFTTLAKLGQGFQKFEHYRQRDRYMRLKTLPWIILPNAHR